MDPLPSARRFAAYVDGSYETMVVRDGDAWMRIGCTPSAAQGYNPELLSVFEAAQKLLLEAVPTSGELLDGAFITYAYER